MIPCTFPRPRFRLLIPSARPLVLFSARFVGTIYLFMVCAVPCVFPLRGLISTIATACFRPVLFPARFAPPRFRRRTAFVLFPNGSTSTMASSCSGLHDPLHGSAATPLHRYDPIHAPHALRACPSACRGHIVAVFFPERRPAPSAPVRVQKKPPCGRLFRLRSSLRARLHAAVRRS